jgi:hypothetical protein
MIPRASLLAVCLFWMAYESHFSSQFFFDAVRASLVDIRLGLDSAMSLGVTPDWHTASSQ